jgi:hypothetical protein
VRTDGCFCGLKLLRDGGLAGYRGALGTASWKRRSLPDENEKPLTHEAYFLLAA